MLKKPFKLKRPDMKRLKKQRILLLPFSLIMAIILLLGSTKAWFTADDTRENFLKTSKLYFDAVIDEVFDPPETVEKDDEIVKVVRVENVRTMPAFVRVLALPVMVSQTGVVLPCNNGSEIEIDYNTTDWKDGGDGYFYYLKVLKPGEKTEPLFTKVKIKVASAEYHNAEFDIQLKSEAVDTRDNNYRISWWQNVVPVSGQLKQIDDILQAAS